MWFLFLLALSACATGERWPADVDAFGVDRHTSADAVCDANTPTLTPPDSLGPLRPGMTLAEIEAVCDDVEYRWLHLEGTPAPALLTRLGEVHVLIEMSDTTSKGTIHRVSTASRAARTADGVGPGMPVADVLARWPDLRVVAGEGVFGLPGAHPGISLRLVIPEGAPEGDSGATERALRSGDPGALPDGTTVDVVLLTEWGA